MSGKILVLTAIDDELAKSRAPDDVEVIYTGVGKINAASATTLALLVLRPKLVINFGTAGAIRKKHKGLIEIGHVVQRDMMAMPLVPRGRTPFSDAPDRLSSGHGNIVCGTGDSFVTSPDDWLTENGIDVVDMELYAVAHVCQRHGVPWRALKFITDNADEHAANDFQENIADGEELFWDVLKTIRKNVQ